MEIPDEVSFITAKPLSNSSSNSTIWFWTDLYLKIEAKFPNRRLRVNSKEGFLQTLSFQALFPRKMNSSFLLRWLPGRTAWRQMSGRTSWDWHRVLSSVRSHRCPHSPPSPAAAKALPQVCIGPARSSWTTGITSLRSRASPRQIFIGKKRGQVGHSFSKGGVMFVCEFVIQVVLYEKMAQVDPKKEKNERRLITQCHNRSFIQSQTTFGRPHFTNKWQLSHNATASLTAFLDSRLYSYGSFLKQFPFFIFFSDLKDSWRFIYSKTAVLCFLWNTWNKQIV